jgi:hypothetical protein
MRPGGRLGLQNRMRPDFVGLGGFDSHALPPVVPNPRTESVSARLNLMCLVSCLCLAAATSAFGQDTTRRVRDSLPVRPQESLTRVQGAALPAPISGKRATLYSAFVPGSAQTILGRHRTAAGMMLVEVIGAVMIFESAGDVRQARLAAADTLITGYVDASGLALGTPTKGPGYHVSADARARQAHVEDWIAVLVANHLFSAAEAFVAAKLWDVKAQVGARSTPSGTVATLQLRW